MTKAVSPAGPDSGLGARLRRGGLEAFVLRAGGVGALFLMNAGFGRMLGREEFGRFRYVLSVAGILAVIVPLGWPPAAMRFVAQYREQGAWEQLKGVVVRAHQLTLASSLAGAAILAAISFGGWWEPAMAVSLRLAAAILPLVAFVAVRRRTFQGFQDVRGSLVPDELVLPLLTIGIGVMVGVQTAVGGVLCYGLASLVVLVLASVWLVRSMPREVKEATASYSTRQWFMVALPLVFSGFSRQLLGRTDVLMLGGLMSMQAVGMYAAANQIALLNTFVLRAVNIIAAPMLGASFHGGDQAGFRLVKLRAMAYSAVGALPMLLIMLLWPKLILGIVFRPEFAAGANLLRVLAVGQFVNAVTGPVGYCLTMSGRERLFAKTLGIVAALNIVGNWLAIPRYGAIGAAFVTAGTTVMLNVWQLWLARTSALFDDPGPASTEGGGRSDQAEGAA